MSNITIVYETKLGAARLAVMEDGELKEIEIIAENRAVEGNVYLGKIARKIELANGKIGYFVELGEGREAFLNAEEYGLDEVNYTEGQSLVVQVAQEKRAEKGPKVTRALQLVGENLVYCPYRLNVEASSKIADKNKAEEYRQFIVENTTGQEGWIVRTSAVKESKEAILVEMEDLRAKYELIRSKARNLKAPVLLLEKDNPLFEYIVRYKNELNKVALNNRNIESEIQERFGEAVVVEVIAEPFEEYGVEDFVAEALSPTVKLKSGGRITIEETKAFVAIDVDSGADKGNGSISRLNEEAALMIAKQICLRNLSGKIIIDFAGSSDFKYLKPVMDVLEKEVAKDFTKTTVVGLSRGGNVEVIRIRKRPTLLDVITAECDCCQGIGRVIR